VPELIFEHTLSIAEHIWLNFFRAFFQQQTLIYSHDGRPMPNAFRYTEATEPANRSFDVLLESDLKTANPNILPALVIDDQGMQELGILLDKRLWIRWAPHTEKERVDLLRQTFVFHCCSRNRGESRLLASIVKKAIDVFYDELLRCGLHKIEPKSIGKSIPIKSDSDEVYVDTPVSVTFELQEKWTTREVTDNYLDHFCSIMAPQKLTRFVRTSLNVVDRSVRRFVLASMDVQPQNVRRYVRASTNLQNPLAASEYVRASLDVVNPTFSSRFVRASMRVA